MELNNSSPIVRPLPSQQPTKDGRSPSETVLDGPHGSDKDRAATGARSVQELRQSTPRQLSISDVAQTSQLANLTSQLRGGTQLSPERRLHAERRSILDSQDQGQTKSGKTFRPNSDVTLLYEAARGKTGTDEDGVYQMYWDRTKEQIRAIELTYEDRLGRGLQKDLAADMKADELKIVELLRQGDRVGGALHALQEGSKSGESGKVVKMLRSLSPEEINALPERFKADGGEKPFREYLEQAFQFKRGSYLDKESDKDSRYGEISALTQGDVVGADVAVLKRTAHESPERLSSVLRDYGPDERVAILQRFEKEEGQGLSAYSVDPHVRYKSANPEADPATINLAVKRAKDRLSKPPPGFDELQALEKGETVQADAIRLGRILTSKKPEAESLFEALTPTVIDSKQKQEHMAAVSHEFSRRYDQDLTESVTSKLDGDDREKALSLLQSGDNSIEEKLSWAVAGKAEKKSTVAALIEQMGPEKARQVFQSREGRDLDRAVTKELGGIDEFEARLALKGKPQSPAEMVARAKERADFEDSGVYGYVTETNNFIARNAARAEVALASLEEAKAGSNPSEIRHFKRRVKELTGYVKEDTELFRNSKDAASEIAAVSATTLVAVGGAAFTGGGSLTLLSVTGGLTAGAVTNWATHSAVQGDGYDETQRSRHLLEGAAEFGAALAGVKVAKFAEKSLRFSRTGQNVLDGALSGSFSEAGREAVAEDTFKDGLWTGTQRVIGSGLLGSAFGAVSGLGTEKASNVVADHLNKRQAAKRLGASESVVHQPASVKLQEASKAANLSRPVEQNFPPSPVWRDKTYQQKPSYQALPPEAQQELDRLIQGNQQSGRDKDRVGEALVGLMDTGRLMKTDSAKKTVLQNLGEIRNKPRLSELSHEADEIFESSTRMVNNPACIHQGDNGTCAATTIQILQAKDDPGEFLRVVDGLTSKGEVPVWFSANEKITVNQPSLAKFDSNTGERIADPRGPVSRVYQPTMMDVAASRNKNVRHEYDPNLRKITSGDEEVEVPPGMRGTFDAIARRGGFRTYDPASHTRVDKNISPDSSLDLFTVEDGLSSSESKWLKMSLFRGKQEFQIASKEARQQLERLGAGQLPDAGAPEAKAVYDQLVTDAQKASEDKASISLALTWSGEGGHAVALTGVTPDGRFIIKNPQVDTTDNLHQLYGLGPARTADSTSLTVEQLTKGYSVMEPDVLLKHYRGHQITESQR